MVRGYSEESLLYTYGGLSVSKGRLIYYRHVLYLLEHDQGNQDVEADLFKGGQASGASLFSQSRGKGKKEKSWSKKKFLGR